MIPENITIIVKAPNQQIEDQNIECQSSWTVKQLKGYLSDVYPNKPKSNEQKIIYSGQLLDDNIILKDVLRTYDNQVNHTMHLVCTPKRIIEPPPIKPEPEPIPSTDGLRHRNVPETEAERPVEVSRPETRQNDQNHTVEMQNYLSSFVNNYARVPPYNMGESYLPVSNDPAAMANHMMMMQQAYLQYMQQYANMWQAAAPAAPPAAEVPATPPAAPAPPAEDEEAARDWLDHLYAASRMAILFSLVYLYGSPARLLLVVLLAAVGYLHQIGFFRDLQVNPQEAPAQPVANGNRNQANNQPINLINNAPNNGVPNNGVPNNEPNNVVPNIEPNNGVPNNGVNNGPNNPTEPTTVPNPTNTVRVNQQSLLAVGWMIFTSFFASLVPDTN